MLSKIRLACIGAVTLLPHLAFAAPGGAMVALADSLPTVSVESICRDAQSAALPDAKAAAYQSCLHEERAALDQLRQKWTHYSPEARITCAEPSGVPISYVELQTCLDMQAGGSLAKPVPDLGGASSLGAIPSPSLKAPMQKK
jgi:hypothetical protein